MNALLSIVVYVSYSECGTLYIQLILLKKIMIIVIKFDKNYIIIVIISKIGQGKVYGEYDADKLNMPQ